MGNGGGKRSGKRVKEALGIKWRRVVMEGVERKRNEKGGGNMKKKRT